MFPSSHRHSYSDGNALPLSSTSKLAKRSNANTEQDDTYAES